jgi:hypothetical protein
MRRLLTLVLVTAACAAAPVATDAGEPAPEFSLLLGDGTTFTLAAEPRPVFLVFWAEW